jgi:putative oxidoreductase
MDFQVGKPRDIPLNSLLKRILQNGWLELASRWILGVTFIYASYGKILSPADFAKIIYGYGLFPATLINLIAIIVPFLQLVIAFALIMGIYPRSAALIVNVLLIAFVILISINLIRGHEFDCGCFALKNSGNQVSSLSTILRDIIFLALGLQVFLYQHYRRWCVPNFLRPEK